jgi:hypothetical protein
MMRIVLILLLAVGCSFAQKVLHVSTIPGKADVYVESIRPDHSKYPYYTSPAYIPANEEQVLNGSMLISIFSPGFADTTLQVKLADKDTSFLIVSLRQTYDEKVLKKQQRDVAKRGRRQLGYKLMLGSIIPVMVGAVSGAVAYYHVSQADDIKKKIDLSSGLESERVQKAQRDFDDHRDKANSAKTVTWTSLSIGASLLAIGFVLSF